MLQYRSVATSQDATRCHKRHLGASAEMALNSPSGADEALRQAGISCALTAPRFEFEFPSFRRALDNVHNLLCRKSDTKLSPFNLHITKATRCRAQPTPNMVSRNDGQCDNAC